MHCKFLDHGVAIGYQNIVRPCCSWQFDKTYKNNNSVQKVNFLTFHTNEELSRARAELQQDIWPTSCKYCQELESQGRQDSTRLNGNRSYDQYQGKDMVLEIRPGIVCNFACQTCSPAASSKVFHYYKAADILKSGTDNTTKCTIVDDHYSESISDFNFLSTISKNLKTVILLGGEPFYDKHCMAFLNWWKTNTDAELIAFTNGSILDIDFLNNLQNKMILVFSLDAVDKQAEYIRFGTNWSTVKKNFQTAKTLANVEVRVNITTSVYNFIYLDKLIDLLLKDWPSVVSFGPATEDIFQTKVIPLDLRYIIVDKLNASIEKLTQSNVEEGQKWNAINALKSIVENLHNTKYSQTANNDFKNFVSKMDTVKKISISDYCPEVLQYIS